MADEHLYQKLFPLIDSSVTVLTPNRRLSATLHKLYQEYQVTQKKDCWQTPDILPITSWIQRLWDEVTSNEMNPSHQLLNTAQEQYTWEKIILNSKQSDQLLQVSETADIAKSAWDLLRQWRVDINQAIFSSAEDYAALRQWSNEFIAICRDHHWIDMATIPDILADKILSGLIKPAPTLILAGFTEFSPQTRHLLENCKLAGSKIEQLEITRHQFDCTRISLSDAEHEISSMAQWAKQILAQDTTARIACVIPSLDKIRDRVMQLFSEVFAASDTHTIDQQTSPFNISAGKNLLQYPLTNAALQLLALHKKIISIEDFSHLLASPFIGDAEVERIKRAKFDSLLRKNNQKTIALAEEDKKLSLTNNTPMLAKRIRQFISMIADADKIMTYHEWAAFFTKQLTVLGWPGERSLSSDEYQVVECWLDLLSEYTTLDQITKPVKLHQALQTLQKMASKTTFQPKTPEAPIQILGVLEAASMPFDYLWVAGMDDISWPPQPKPNPFIPKQLQRELQMPHATAERELFFCKNLISQFRQCATHVIYSHAEKDEELELQCSPLIRDIAEVGIEHLKLAPHKTSMERIYESKNIEIMLDEIAPSYVNDSKVHGGVDVIKQQALCPFKAFATHRLHARELESPLPGMRPKDRGNIIHKVLEMLWNNLHDQATLVAMNESELNGLIDNCINEALTSMTIFLDESTQYIALEKKRLHKLVRDWLDIEKTRPAFRVSAIEVKTQTIINHLSLDIRIDRIDELADGGKLIIDYKSGKNNDINAWFSDRPEEPQLPVYALLDPDNTVGICFAQFYPGDNCFKGVSSHSLEIDGVKTISEIKKTSALSWREQINQWQLVLTSLSDDFYAGIARVDPKDPAQTCTWCALKPLCRINEEL